MKQKLYPTVCALFIALFLQFNQISAQSLIAGTFPSASESILGSRYRNLAISNSNQNNALYSGIPDLATNRSNTRTSQDLNYGISGTFDFTITYDNVGNTYTTTINIGGTIYNSTLSNVNSKLIADSKTATANSINLLTLLVKTQNSTSSITISNLTIEGIAVSGSYGRTNNTGTSNWYISSSSLTNGFVVTGTATVTGTLGNGVEGQMIEFGFSNAAAAGPLPVVWGGFTTKRINTTSALLEWKTMQENNASHFNVQRSVDGVRFETIAKIAAQGTTANVTDYRFEDKQATGNMYYYRLQQVDFDTKMNFSNVVKQGNGGKQTLVGGLGGSNILVQFFTNENRQLRVLSATGTVVKQMTTTSMQQTIDMNSFPTGVYTLQIINANGSAEVHRFVK